MDHISLCGYEDDDEHGAGCTIYKVLENKNTFNRAVFVVRHYGNKHLGPVHFQLIVGAAKSAITRLESVINGNRAHTQPQTGVYPNAPAPWQAVSNKPGSAKTGDGARNKEYALITSPRPFIQSWGSR